MLQDSSAYQAIVEEGRAFGRIEGLLRCTLPRPRATCYMQESSAYHIMFDEGRDMGRLEGLAQRLLLRHGSRRFGEPDHTTEKSLLAITDLDRLDRLTDAVLTTTNWRELLATP
jgi:hypothetical protein